MQELIEAWREHVLSLIKRTKCKNGRYVLFAKDNRRVFDILKMLGCFEFYCTNQMNIIGESQVVAYLHHGYKAWLRGFTAPAGSIEVHHINGRIDDNSPENLVYLSKQDHLIVSSCTNTPLIGEVRSENSTPFNRQGRTIENAKHFLANIVRETLEAVSQARGGIKAKVNLARILICLPGQIHQQVIRSYMPEWMTKLILTLTYTPDEGLRFNYG